MNSGGTDQAPDYDQSFLYMIKRFGFVLIFVGLVGLVLGALSVSGAVEASVTGWRWPVSNASPAVTLGPVLSGLAVVSGVALVVMGIRPPAGVREPRPRANV